MRKGSRCLLIFCTKTPRITRERITVFSLEQVDPFVYINDIANYTSRQVTHQKAQVPPTSLIVTAA